RSSPDQREGNPGCARSARDPGLCCATPLESNARSLSPSAHDRSRSRPTGDAMLPAPPNITCDVYRDLNGPPGTPDVAAVRGHLPSVFAAGLEAGQGIVDTDQRFSHILLVAVGVDIRDGYDAGSISAVFGPDRIYVPDRLGTSFRVVFVERRLRGTAFD